MSAANERRPEHNLLHQFEQQAAATPEATALILGVRTYTYRQVNERANQIGRALQALGVGAEQLVGICLPRSCEAVMAMLGIIKAGAAYVPIDPTYPVERQRFLAADAKLQVLLTDQAERLAHLQGVVEHLLAWSDASWQQTHATTNLDVPVAAESLLYVLYTSGSTGHPKGVCGSHAQMRNRLAWLWSAFPPRLPEVWCHKTTLHFVDASLEIFGALLQGAPLVILPEADATNPERLVQVLAQQGVTRLFLVISHLRALLLARPDLGRQLPALHLWVVSGERLTQSLVASFYAAFPQAQLVNLYGCTEVPEISWVPVPADLGQLDAPIGRPIPDSTVYIVDEALQPVSMGEVGELVVNSPLMSLGYLQRPAETATRFLADPFAATGRIYRTGDRVYQSTDGLLHYVGRLDHLVKIRGYRVELPEIEAALTQADSTIKVAVVVVREDPQLAENKQLIAFVTPATVDVGALQATLQQRLPAYMIPEQMIPLAALPLTPSGKADRQAMLATMQPIPLAVAADASPREIITHLWRTILQSEQVQPQTNFFEAGGNSLRLAQLHQQLRTCFGARTPSLTRLLQYPTLDALVAHFEQPTEPALLEAASPAANPPINRHAAARQLRARRQGSS